jgi:YegS/Rv2252/BmrU family lipid kinase
VLSKAGYVLAMTPTTGPGVAGEMARRAIDAGTQLVLAAGGDGTINEILAGVAHTPVPLGILPAGTANVLATELGLSRNLERAAAMLPTCVARRIAIGRLESSDTQRYFLSMAGVGFDAHIVYHLNDSLKRLFGKSAYWIGGFGEIVRRYPEFHVEIDGIKQPDSSFALVSRVRNYGGDFEIARSASLVDDHFEAVLFRGRSPLPYLKYVAGMVTRQLSRMRGVSFLDAKVVRVSDPQDRRIYVQVDGENAGRLPATLSLVPDALTLLIPPHYPPMRQSHQTDPA